MAHTHEEIRAHAEAHRADLQRIAELFPAEIVRRYLKESYGSIAEEMKDTVVVPKFDEEEIKDFEKFPCSPDVPAEAKDEIKGRHEAMLTLAGKTGKELEEMHPTSEAEYVEGIKRVRLGLARYWVHTLTFYRFRHRPDGAAFRINLGTNLLPRQSKAEIKRQFGSHLEHMQRDLWGAGIVYEERQNTCFAEFVRCIKAYLLNHPEGLVLSSYNKIRLCKVGRKFVVRDA